MSKKYILKDLNNSNYQMKKPVVFDIVRPKRIVIERNTAIEDMETVTQQEVWEDKLSRLYSKDSSIVPYVLRYKMGDKGNGLWDYGRTLKEAVSNMKKGLISMYKDFKDYDNGTMKKEEYEVINEGGKIYYRMKSHVIGCNARAHKAFLCNHIKGKLDA
ncbi:hypothetical protein ES705_42281 [subsurface metagenome]